MISMLQSYPRIARRTGDARRSSWARRYTSAVQEPSALARLVYDLHDGPLQALAVLRGDVELFRTQVADACSGSANVEPLVGRVDDFAARLEALDDELRAVSRSFVPRSSLAHGTLVEALGERLQAFESSTGIAASLETDGDLSRISSSQEDTLLRVVDAALANVRQHSSAGTVRVRVARGERELAATVDDDGCGFDPPSALARAAAAGRLGLVGMRERARSHGGHVMIRSCPRGRTSVRVTLPDRPREDERLAVGAA